MVIFECVFIMPDILSTGSGRTGICSYEYWCENIEEWVNTLNEALDLEMDADDYTEEEIRSIAGADVAGFIAGGVVGVLVGGVPGIIPGAVSGGLFCSIYGLFYHG
jgi:hypothetical protein